MTSDIPGTREVLLEHLAAQLRSLPLNVTAEEAASAVEILGRHSSNDDIIGLLQDKCKLQTKLDSLRNARDCKTEGEDEVEDKDEIGDQLFLRVALIDSQLCAQITGMLLELDVETLRKLLANSKDLEVAAKRARDEYLRFIRGTGETTPHSQPISPASKSSDLSLAGDKEKLGEELYGAIALHQPEHAAKVTGMLLEMDAIQLRKLLDCPPELEKMINVALRVLDENAPR